eukprot:gene17092-19485_t
MQSVVGTASAHIQQIQTNVTREIDDMTQKVHKIVTKLGDNVKAAEDTIREEVQGVQAKIEQYVIVTNKQFAAENDFVKYQLAGTFTLLGCLISMWHLTSHLRHYYKPDVQRRIMAVLWMVPIYSITSWLSMVFPKFEPFFGAFRDCYEAYAIYTFIAMLIAIIEDGRGLSGMISLLAERVVEERDAVIEYERLVAERAQPSRFFLFNLLGSREPAMEELTRLPARPTEHIKPPFPCCYQVHRPSTVAAAWLYQCQLMAAQFVILRPFLAVVPLILKFSGTYDIHAVPIFVNGTVNWLAPNFYILFAQNLSVGIAFYGLLSFYHGTEKDLEWCDPWPKFLCIKGVVFATFWQSLTIQMLSTMGRVDERTAVQVQNLLICIEMLLASIAHFYIFPYEEWKDGYKREREKGIMLKDTLALRDFVKDMKLMVTSWNTEEPQNEEDGEETVSHRSHSLNHGHLHGLDSKRGVDLLDEDIIDMEKLSAEKAKLASELHELASRSSALSERSNSVSGGGVMMTDVERGLSHSNSHLAPGGSGGKGGGGGWNTFSYDDAYSYLAGAYGHSAEKEKERQSLLFKQQSQSSPSLGYHSPEQRKHAEHHPRQPFLESRGLHREESSPATSSLDGMMALQHAHSSKSSFGRGVGRQVGTRLGSESSENIKAALLKKIHLLENISPINPSGKSAPPYRPTLFGSRSTSGASHAQGAPASVGNSSSNDDFDIAGLPRSFANRSAQPSAPATHSGRNLTATARQEAGGANTVGRTDSLTYSPDSSAIELRQSLRAAHPSHHKPKQSNNPFADMAGNITSEDAAVGLDLTPFDVVEVESEGELSDTEEATHRTPHHRHHLSQAHQSHQANHSHHPHSAQHHHHNSTHHTADGARTGLTSATDTPFVHPNIAFTPPVLTPLLMSLGTDGQEDNTNIFHDVLTPPPERSFSSSRLRGLAQHLEDEDSDQSEYAI